MTQPAATEIPRSSGDSWRPLGERPFSAVLLPTALTVGIYLLRTLRHVSSDDWSAGGFALSVLFAVTVLVVLFSVLERRSGLTPWIATAGIALAIGDAHYLSVSARVVAPLFAIAVMLHVALRRIGVLPGSPPRLMGLERFSAAAAAATALALLWFPHEAPAGAVAGYSLVILLVGGTWELAARGLRGHLTAVLAVGIVGLLPTVLAGPAPPEGTRSMLLGACGGLLVAGLLCGARNVSAIATGVMVAVVALALGPVYVVAPLAWILAAIVGFGLGPAVLASSGFRPGRTGSTWSRTPLVAWITCAGFSAYLFVEWLATWDLAATRDQLPMRLLMPLLSMRVILPAVMMLSALALLLPIPAGVIRSAQLLPLRARLRAAATAVWDRVAQGCSTGDRGAERGLDALARWAQPVLGPRRPAEPAAPPASGAVATAVDYAKPVALWLALLLVVQNVAANANLLGGRWPTRLVQFSFFGLDPGGRVGWGTGDYAVLAEQGYTMTDAREAFLPALPLTLRWLHQLTGAHILTLQVAVATASGLACVVLFWAWMRRRGVPHRSRFFAMVLFLTFPWNFLLYGYGYADATLVALLLGAFLLAEHDRPLLAGMVGALAAVTRPNGVAIIPALLLHELLRSGALERAVPPAGWGLAWIPHDRISIQLGRMRPARWGVLLSATLIGVFSLWMWQHAGSPLYWLTLNEYYGHEPITHLAAWTESLFDRWPAQAIDNPYEAGNQLATAAVTLGSLLMIPAIWRRFGASYGVFAALIWVIAWTGSRVFTPGGRLIMPMTPFLAALAAPWLVRRPALAWSAAAVSLAGSLTLVVLFTRGGNLWVGW